MISKVHYINSNSKLFRSLAVISTPKINQISPFQTAIFDSVIGALFRGGGFKFRETRLTQCRWHFEGTGRFWTIPFAFNSVVRRTSRRAQHRSHTYPFQTLWMRYFATIAKFYENSIRIVLVRSEYGYLTIQCSKRECHWDEIPAYFERKN